MSTLTLRGKPVEAVGNWVPLWNHVQHKDDQEHLKSIKALVLIEDSVPIKVSISEDCDTELDFAEIEEEQKLLEHTIRHLSGKYVYLNDWDGAEGEGEVVNNLTVGCPACLHFETNAFSSGLYFVEELWTELAECFCEDCREVVPNPEMLHRDNQEILTFVLYGIEYYVQITDAQNEKLIGLYDLEGDANQLQEWTRPATVPNWVQRILGEEWEGLEHVTSH